MDFIEIKTHIPLTPKFILKSSVILRIFVKMFDNFVNLVNNLYIKK